MTMKNNLKAVGLAAMLGTSVVPQANAGLISVVADTANCYKVDGPRVTESGNPSGTIDMCIGDGFATYNISSGLNIDQIFLPVFNDFDFNDFDLVTSEGNSWNATISDFGTKYLNLSGPSGQEIKDTTFELRSDNLDFTFGDVNSAVIFDSVNGNELYGLPTLGYTLREEPSTPVPEPSTLALFALGAGLALGRKKFINN